MYIQMQVRLNIEHLISSGWSLEPCFPALTKLLVTCVLGATVAFHIPCRRPIHRAASLSHSIPHLDNACSPLEVVVHGSSLMPYCHFDLEQSDYLTRRAMREGKGGAFGDGRAVSDPSSTRVIEFHSCGVGIRIVR